MTLAQHIPDSIKRAVRSIGYAIWLDDTDSWMGLVPILQARLAPHQRAALAFVALKALDSTTAKETASAALSYPSAQQPIAPLHDHMAEAAFWADMAEPEALEAYCLASFNRMAPARQTAFLEFAQGRAAA